MQAFDFHLPVEIIFGCGRVNGLAERMRKNWKNVFIVTDRNVAKSTGHLDRLRSLLKGCHVRSFDAVEENPSFSTLENGREQALAHEADLVIGLGGGSPMDAAKGIAVLATNKESMETYLSGAPLDNKPLPVVCLPTTSGTGSEVTPFAVFTDRDSESKVCLAHKEIFPVFSIVDPELTFTMPEHVVADTGLDALTHALEAFLSTDSFPLNDLLAMESASRITSHLHRAVQKDEEAMSHMAYASLLGGAAIVHASTILLHIMGYPLTVFHGLSHGRANAALLPAFMRFMKDHSSAHEKVAHIEALFEPFGTVESYVQGLGISTHLHDYGVRESDLSRFAGKVVVKGDVEITPAELSEEVIVGIYRSAL